MTKSIITGLLLMCGLFTGTVVYAQDQKSIDDKLITEYLAKNKIKANKTPSGLYYTIHRKGEGDNAKPGMQVTMLYYGYTLDGKRFDGNMDQSYKPTGNPFTFPLGAHRVIAGWDEGVQLLNKGCRATLYLPSGLGYGAAGAGGAIPPNAVLAFDVELVSMSK